MIMEENLFYRFINIIDYYILFYRFLRGKKEIGLMIRNIERVEC